MHAVKIFLYLNLLCCFLACATQRDRDDDSDDAAPIFTETKPAEHKPAEHKPAEHKPAEHKPAEHKPAEHKPAEHKPAETVPICPRGRILDTQQKCQEQLSAKISSDTYDYVWIQKAYSASNDLSSWWVRAVTLLDTCPLINSKTMQLRSAILKHENSVIFPRVCQYEIKPEDGLIFQIEGQKEALSIPKNEKEVAFVGDTGCEVENCVEDWYFDRVTREISKRSTISDSLIVHVGDYVYRKGMCPSETYCDQGRGDNWRVWHEEFFKPSVKLFNKAPFLFVRGNHEDCANAFRGWFLFLDAKAEFDPKKLDPDYSCQVEDKFSPPFRAKFGTYDFAILDSAYAKSTGDILKNSATIDVLSTQLQKLNAFYRDTDDVFILSHRPFWGLIWNYSEWTPNTISLAEAYNHFLNQTPQSHFKHVVSGHIHLFGYTSFKDKSIDQIIFGHSGAELSPVSSSSLRQLLWPSDQNDEVEIDRNIYGKIIATNKYRGISSVPEKNFGYGLLTQGGEAKHNEIESHFIFKDDNFSKEVFILEN